MEESSIILISIREKNASQNAYDVDAFPGEEQGDAG
jgi:hypothetical protein